MLDHIYLRCRGALQNHMAPLSQSSDTITHVWSLLPALAHMSVMIWLQLLYISWIAELWQMEGAHRHACMHQGIRAKGDLVGRLADLST